MLPDTLVTALAASKTDLFAGIVGAKAGRVQAHPAGGTGVAGAGRGTAGARLGVAERIRGARLCAG